MVINERMTSPTHSYWQIDQTTLHQGIGEATLAYIRTVQTDASRWWQTLDALAAVQPMVHGTSAQMRAEIGHQVSVLSEIADRLVVIGTGGASLSGQAFCAVAPHPARVQFIDNPDSDAIRKIFEGNDLTRTAWLIISKSGDTVETVAGSLALIAHYQSHDLPLNDRVHVITQAKPSALRKLAELQGWSITDHPDNIGGRFSGFTCVGMMPAAFAGVDIDSLAQTARETWEHLLHTRDPLLFDAANCYAHSLTTHPVHAVMAYGNRMRGYTQWYKQIWAESLGKQGIGPTPVTAIGAIDQHNQLQLYLDGPRDKVFTLILPTCDVSIPLAHVAVAELKHLGGQVMENIMQASAEATCATLAAHSVPLRVFRGKLNVFSIAALMVRTILETLLMSAMLGVDPFTQPAVEEGKQRARQRLGYSA